MPPVCSLTFGAQSPSFLTHKSIATHLQLQLRDTVIAGPHMHYSSPHPCMHRVRPHQYASTVCIHRVAACPPQNPKRARKRTSSQPIKATRASSYLPVEPSSRAVSNSSVNFVLGASCDDACRACKCGELDSCRAHATPPCVDQHNVALLYLANQVQQLVPLLPIRMCRWEACTKDSNGHTR